MSEFAWFVIMFQPEAGGGLPAGFKMKLEIKWSV